MSRLSKEKRDKIVSNVLSLLYSKFPEPLFTAEIAREEARDEEFIKRMLIDLEKKNLVRVVRKNPSGVHYIRRMRWSLTTKAYNAYKDQL